MAKRRYSKKGKHTVRNGITYDSKMEADLHEGALKDCLFHSVEHKVPYVIQHTYEPDYVYEHEGKTYIIESKGWFRPGDIQKYKAIIGQLPENYEMVFVLYHRDKPMSKVVRKDGTKRTMEEVIEKTFKCRCYHRDDVNLLDQIKSST